MAPMLKPSLLPKTPCPSQHRSLHAPALSRSNGHRRAQALAPVVPSRGCAPASTTSGVVASTAAEPTETVAAKDTVAEIFDVSVSIDVDTEVQEVLQSVISAPPPADGPFEQPATAPVPLFPSSSSLPPKLAPPPAPLAPSPPAAIADIPPSPSTPQAQPQAQARHQPQTRPLPSRRSPEVQLPLERLLQRAEAGRSPRPFPPPVDLQRLGDAVLGEPTIGPIFDELFKLSRQRKALRTSPSSPSFSPSSSASSFSSLPSSSSIASSFSSAASFSSTQQQDASKTSASGADTRDPGFGAVDPASAGPMLYTPRFPRPPGSPPASSLPLLVYLPGIDGTGLAAYRQFPGLASKFDLRGVFLPPEDRTPFEGLVEALAQQLEEEAADLDPSRPVYLLGESFGALLALALARRLDIVDRLVLVNPATSFERSPWPSLGPLLTSLPPEVYRLLPVALAPLLSNPLSMATWNVSRRDPPQQQLVDLLYGLLDLVPELSSLRVVLPPETLSWRLNLLAQGARVVNANLSKVRQRTLLLVGDLDLVIPSASEAPRLEAALPRCIARRVAEGSHALLQQASVDLAAILQEEDFYVSRRRFSRPVCSSLRPAPGRPRKAAPGGANFGSPGPIELPNPGELRRARDQAGVTTLRRLVSPVFTSTDAGTGRVLLGLEGLPAPSSGPLLFVGNHQLFAPDMYVMVDHFLESRGQMLRGLAHPMTMGMAPTNNGSPGGSLPNPESNQRFGRFLQTYGAVPVSGRNLYGLLQAGEAALLYPGGVREALKLKDEQYALIWPRRAEFVRMACKFGATIIPFAGVGAEDCVQLLVDRRELLSAPLLGDWLRQQQGKEVAARRGVSISEDVEESFIPPVIAPKAPARFYFRFGAPIRTDPRTAEDRTEVDNLYGRVRHEVEDCLGYLLRKREQDPYKDLAPRLLYEATWGGRRQAPTFTP